MTTRSTYSVFMASAALSEPLVLASLPQPIGGGTSGLIEGNAGQLAIQAFGCVVVAIWCAVVSFGLLFAIEKTMGLRVSREVEIEGLDLNLHGEVVP